MSYEVQAVTEPLLGGEGPHWDHNQQALFFVDVVLSAIHKYSPATNKHTKTKLDKSPHFIIPVEDTTDQFVVGAGRKFLIIRWDGEDGSAVELMQELGEVDQDRPLNCINDGKADPRGRLFTGSMEIAYSVESLKPERGSLFRVSTESGAVSIQTLAKKIGVSNGLAWDVKEKAFYYIDSLEYKVRRYDYDVETGNICNLSYVFDVREHNLEGLPDGASIDTDGNLWFAVCGSSYVVKIDPRTGKLLEKYYFPCKTVSSVAFGGPDLDVLFVTSIGVSSPTETLPPPSGSLFMVTGLGVKGHPNVSFKL